ncbi:MAG: MBL fold metallo-hydrolase [Crocinitomix sp.]|nr:MBL fold metallo-hydrolase [Crocinitomix sp.]
MIQIAKFTFNPFQENTFILSDETKECVIIDPGCQTKEEKETLSNYISEKGLTPVRLLNTHCHVDHVFGNYYVSKKYNLPVEANELDLPTLKMVPQACMMYGIKEFELSPEPTVFLNEGDVVTFGNSKLDVIFTPGHAPGHVVFYAAEDGFVVNGDVLFLGSHGRTDLPGGDHQTLKKSIIEKMFVLPDETIVLSGHGSETTIGQERHSNPILR